jgi:choline dehydrogenase-like flavoprotein
LKITSFFTNSLLLQVPSSYVGLQGSSMDWQYETLPNNNSCLASRNKRCRYSSGRCLGGSTSINDMIHIRGDHSDFDNFGIPHWTSEDIKPYFLRFEGLKNLDKLPTSSAPYHNTTGPMSMEFFTDPANPWHSRMVEGYKALNITFNPDANAQSQVGVTKVVGYVYQNERMSTARGYLERKDVQNSLKVAKFTKCTGLIIGNDNITQGITVIHGLFRRKLNIFANKEVILSAGALATPQILMLSGIGPADHLKQLNITVKSDLPVGYNLTDHYLPLIFVKVDDKSNGFLNLFNFGTKITQLAELLFLKKGPLGSNGLLDICTFINTNCYDFHNGTLNNDKGECGLATTQLMHVYIDKGLVWLAAPLIQQATDLDNAVIDQLKQLSKNYAFIAKHPVVLKPYSRGIVRLRSKDPLDTPAIQLNYLSDARDMDEMMRAIRMLEDLMKTAPYKQNNASIVHLKLEGCPSYEDNSVAYWKCYCRHMTRPAQHAVGTTALGDVVDSNLRVRGVSRLRVADLGVLPGIPRGNTAAAAIAIGERVADFILTEDN